MNFIQEISYILVFSIGNWLTVLWRKRKDDPDTLFFCSLWSFISLFVYLAIIELQTGTFYILLPLTFLGIFLFSYFKEKRRLLNGWLFNIFLLSFGFYLVFNILQTQNLLVGGLLAVILVAALLIGIFGIYGLLIFLYWNAIVVLKKESHSLANLLTLLLAIGLTIVLLFNWFVVQTLPNWLAILLAYLPVAGTYFFIVFYNFLTISVIYQFNHPRYDQDYIIVLGAGLIDGQRVSPLLAQRIDKAIEFYRLQLRATGKELRLIMSGGQGADEKVPEAIAMKNYALSQGIPEQQILVETNSTTTLENMTFSKEIIQQQTGGSKALFSSNNYHIFRAGIYARWANLKADGIGAPTAFYYLPNAFLREYIAIIMLNKKRHLLIAGGIALFFLFIMLLSFFVR